MTHPGQSDIAGRAQLAQKNRQPGYYVVNSSTGLAIAGPFENDEAAVQEATLQNAAPDAPADAFEVRVMVFG